MGPSDKQGRNALFATQRSICTSFPSSSSLISKTETVSFVNQHQNMLNKWSSIYVHTTLHSGAVLDALHGRRLVVGSLPLGAYLSPPDGRTPPAAVASYSSRLQYTSCLRARWAAAACLPAPHPRTHCARPGGGVDVAALGRTRAR